MSEKRFYQLISRKLSGEASVAELNELESYLNGDAEKRKVYDVLTQPTVSDDHAMSKAGQAFALHQLKMHIHQPATEFAEPSKPKRIYKLKTYQFAAAAVLILIASVFIFKSDWISVPKTEVSALRGSRTNIKLPDGSVVWLNSDSKINYRNDFGNGHRELWLIGEAFFDVKHDPSHPFVIHTDKINIKVLGTAFNVKSYPTDNYIQTSLIRGKIDVNFTDRPEEHIIMRPNEKLTVNKDQETKMSSAELIKAAEPKIRLENITSIAKDNIVAETAWLKNKVVFDNTPFYEIAGILERRFDIKVKFNNEKDKQSSFTGIFQDEDLNEILNLMKITKPFKYELNKKQLTIN